MWAAAVQDQMLCSCHGTMIQVHAAWLAPLWSAALGHVMGQAEGGAVQGGHASLKAGFMLRCRIESVGVSLPRWAASGQSKCICATKVLCKSTQHAKQRKAA